MLCCIVIMQVLHIVLSCIIYASNNTVDIANRLFGNFEAYAAILGISLLAPAVAFGAVGSLLSFHIYIKLRGTTTYLFLKGKDVIQAELDAETQTKRSKSHEQKIEERREREKQRWLEERNKRRKKKVLQAENITIQLSSLKHSEKKEEELSSVHTIGPSNVQDHHKFSSNETEVSGKQTEVFARAVMVNLGTANIDTVSEGVKIPVADAEHV
mmetsp:Transcript_26740/g.37312  ORF Transcript_26740/g.37312 Transcript_26740/m.37312 type:complete len:213 (+) Transcript_26740:590-1228(+)